MRTRDVWLGDRPGRQHGFTEEVARIARTHGQWREATALADLLVALADTLWKGSRDRALEDHLARQISLATGAALWSVRLLLDDLA